MKKATKHLRRILERRAAEHKEDVAREVRKHGQVRPIEHQVGTKSWKSYSKVRYSSTAFRDGYSRIDWGK